MPSGILIALGSARVSPAVHPASPLAGDGWGKAFCPCSSLGRTTRIGFEETCRLDRQSIRFDLAGAKENDC